MKKTITKEICDLCNKEVSTREFLVPTFRTFDSNDGRMIYSSKKYLNETLDLCDECLEKVTVIHSVGVQCHEYKYVGEDNE